jgi:hypothetical protein
LTGRCALRASRGLRRSAEQDRNKIVIRDRIFVFFAEVSLIHQKIDRRRKGSWPRFSLKQPDGSRVLLAAEHEFGLLVAPSHVIPHRHDHCEHDRHDAEAHEQGRHGVSLLLTP